MKITKAVQAYIGLVSVFALVLVGFGTYVSQFNILSPSANTILDDFAIPSIGINLDSFKYDVGDKGSFIVESDFSFAPVTDALISISFPKNLIEVKSIATSGGILGKAKSVYGNQDEGIITLSFAPLIKSDSQGTIAKINFTTVGSGEGKIDFLSLGTTLSNGANVIPEFSGADLIIE